MNGRARCTRRERPGCDCRRAAPSIVTTATVAAALPSERPLSFSAVRLTRGDDPHAYGLVIELFRHDEQWTGFISEYVGPVADPPSAGPEDVRLDEATGRIPFSATVTIGVTMAADAKTWVPARSRYGFSGTIGPDTIAGGQG